MGPEIPPALDGCGTTLIPIALVLPLPHTFEGTTYTFPTLPTGTVAGTLRVAVEPLPEMLAPAKLVLHVYDEALFVVE